MISKARLAYVLSVGLLVSSVLATGWQVIVSRTINVNQGCGYDGAVYCQMFYGQAGAEPFGRRILAPILARLLSANPLVGFRILDVLVVAGTMAVAVALVLWSTRTRAAAGRTDRVIAVLITLSVLLVTRNLLRFDLSYPVITDPLALFLLLLAAYGLLRLHQSRWFVLVAVVGAFLAPLAREIFGIGIIGGAVAVFLFHRKTWPRAAIVAAAAAGGTVLAFVQVPSSSTGGVVSVMEGWVVSDFGSASGLIRFATMLLIGLGYFWIPFLWKRFRNRLEPPEWVLLATAAVLFAASVFGGGDTDRIVMPVGILLTLAIARIATRDGTTALGLVFLAAAYFITEFPFTVVGSGADDWIGFFSLRDTPLINLENNGIVPVLLAVPLAVAGVLIVALGDALGERPEPEPDPASAVGPDPASSPLIPRPRHLRLDHPGGTP